MGANATVCHPSCDKSALLLGTADAILGGRETDAKMVI